MKLRFFSQAVLLCSIGNLYAVESADNTDEPIYKTLNFTEESRQILRDHKNQIQEKQTPPLLVLESGQQDKDPHKEQVISAIKKIAPTTATKIGLLPYSWSDQSSSEEKLKKCCGISPQENGPFVINISYCDKLEVITNFEFGTTKEIGKLIKHGHIVVKSIGNNRFEYRQPDSGLNPLEFETEAKNTEKLLEEYSQEERGRFIFVGSLTSDGKQIASYSNIAISPHWASQTIFCPPWNQKDKEKAIDTSFSAPIVAASIKMIGDTFQLPYKDATRIIFETAQERQLKREERSNSKELRDAVFAIKIMIINNMNWDIFRIKMGTKRDEIVKGTIRKYCFDFNTVDKIKSNFEKAIRYAFRDEIYRPILPNPQRHFCGLCPQPELSLEEQEERFKRVIDERTENIIEEKFLPSFEQYFTSKQEVYTVKVLDIKKAILRAKEIAQQRIGTDQLNGFNKLSLD